MTGRAALTSKNTIQEWLDHSVCGPVLRGSWPAAGGRTKACARPAR